MRYPKYLEIGGTIGFVAPSFGYADELRRTSFARTLENFHAAGYQTKIGPNCYAGDGIGISSTPENCAKELTDFYCDPEVDAMIACAGGELMCETMSCVDLEKIAKAEPKWYMGYSDNTNFTFLLTTMFDTASIYGPGARSFAMEPRHASIDDAFGLMTGKTKAVHSFDLWQKERSPEEETNPYCAYLLSDERVSKLWEPTEGKLIDDLRTWNGTLEFEGRLIGGCMDCLVNLLGTRFDKVKDFNEKYKEDGVIWFLESCDLNVFSIRRAMWQMEEAGWFQNVKGFLIGRPLCFGQEMLGLDQYEAILGIARKYQVPVLMDLDIGHLPPQMPILCGSIGKVKLKGNDLQVAYEMR
ncbi:MAG: LD-carboxypeptidase [Lachnospiraceae bacterium]|nr:LD-carboxypeptidase [Lachnospiraceae bacterium]